MITSQDYVAGTSAKTLNPANPQVIVIDPILQEADKRAGAGGAHRKDGAMI